MSAFREVVVISAASLSRTSRPLAAALALFAAGGLTACEDLSGNEARQDASVSFHVVSGANLSASPADLLLISEGDHTLDLQSVDVVVDEVTFEMLNGQPDDDDDSETDSDSDGGHNARVRVGASTIALPLEGGVITPFSGPLPEGTYDRLELDVEFARLRGTYDGQAFDVTVPINAEYELDLVPPLVVDANNPTPNVTVNLDIAQWLRTSTGTLIDPLRLQTDAEYRADFIRRIRASIHAMEDSDRDGDEMDSDSDSDGDSDGEGN